MAAPCYRDIFSAVFDVIFMAVYGGLFGAVYEGIFVTLYGGIFIDGYDETILFDWNEDNKGPNSFSTLMIIM